MRKPRILSIPACRGQVSIQALGPAEEGRIARHAGPHARSPAEAGFVERLHKNPRLRRRTRTLSKGREAGS